MVEIKLKKYHWYFLAGAIVIPICALLDTLILGKQDFIGYVIICFVEWMIFFGGILVGWRLKEDENL